VISILETERVARHASTGGYPENQPDTRFDTTIRFTDNKASEQVAQAPLSVHDSSMPMTNARTLVPMVRKVAITDHTQMNHVRGALCLVKLLCFAAETLLTLQFHPVGRQTRDV